MTGPLSITQSAGGYGLSLQSAGQGISVDLSVSTGALLDLMALGNSYFRVSLFPEPVLQVARALNSHYIASFINTGDTNATGVYIKATNVTAAAILNLAGPGDVDLFQFLTDGRTSLGLAAPDLSGTGKVHMGGNSFRLDQSRSPASNAAGKAGEFCWDANYLYVCVATNTWKRMAITGGY